MRSKTRSHYYVFFTEEAGPAFYEFMDLIGDRVVLKGFEGYRAQLDNRSRSLDNESSHSRFLKFFLCDAKLSYIEYQYH